MKLEVGLGIIGGSECQVVGIQAACDLEFLVPCSVGKLAISSGSVCALQVLHLTQDLPVSVTLKNIIQRSFPEEYKERQQEMAGRLLTCSAQLLCESILMAWQSMARSCAVVLPKVRISVHSSHVVLEMQLGLLNPRPRRRQHSSHG